MYSKVWGLFGYANYIAEESLEEFSLYFWL